MSQTIFLKNHGQVVVDDVLYPHLMKQEWFAVDGGAKHFYAARRERQPDGKYKTIYMHQEIVRRWCAIYPSQFTWPLEPDVVCSFDNGDSLDCRVENLILLTPLQFIQRLADNNSKQKRTRKASKTS